MDSSIKNARILKENKDILEAILTVVSKCFNIPKKEIVSEKRTPKVVLARFFVWSITRELYYKKVTLDIIGEFFGRKHETISYGIDSLAVKMFNNEKITAKYNKTKNAVKLVLFEKQFCMSKYEICTELDKIIKMPYKNSAINDLKNRILKNLIV